MSDEHGDYFNRSGDYFGAQETSLEAIKYFDENNKGNYSYISANYNNLGIASYNLKSYENALGFYDSAIKFSFGSDDVFIYLNNKGNTYREQGKYIEAINAYNKILKNKLYWN